MFVPQNHRIDELEAELGEAHVLYEWRDDVTLRGRWPTRKRAQSLGVKDHRYCVACFHWRAISGRTRQGMVILVADSWKDPAVACFTDVRFALPIVVIRVHMPQRKSQYLGWLTPKGFLKIGTVNWSWKKDAVRYRRVILPGHLSIGLPQVDRQGGLFEDERIAGS